jgi:UDP-N-acetylglucosamine--N-acetylmuramyl-(pentapeptide) pyrophosphoryl-undecaprenol N-acetylglucosamine transferase
LGKNTLKFMFACGGTAGHIYPAIAVAGKLKELMPDACFMFVGAKGKMEEELVPREGYDIKTLEISNLQRSLSPRGVAHNLKAALAIPGALRNAARIIRDFKPDAVLGTGGYVCYPVIREASRLGITHRRARVKRRARSHDEDACRKGRPNTGRI